MIREGAGPAPAVAGGDVSGGGTMTDLRTATSSCSIGPMREAMLIWNELGFLSVSFLTSEAAGGGSSSEFAALRYAV
jgi:hypothetical protein